MCLVARTAMSRLVACFDRAQARVWLAVPLSVDLHARVQLRSFFTIQPTHVGKWKASFARGLGQREAGAPESSNQTCGKQRGLENFTVTFAKEYVQSLDELTHPAIVRHRNRT
jgi:hypothetical protein